MDSKKGWGGGDLFGQAVLLESQKLRRMGKQSKSAGRWIFKKGAEDKTISILERRRQKGNKQADGQLIRQPDSQILAAGGQFNADRLE